MKKVGLFSAVAIALIVSVTLISAEETPWFDMENCSFCRHLLTDPHLLDNMTWDQYDIANGLLIVTTVKPEFQASYLKAMTKMEKLGQEMAAGKTDVKVCGHCQFYGKLLMSGAKFEHVSTAMGEIDLITSDKPEVLKMIREYGQRNREEMAKTEKMEKEIKEEK